MKSRRRQRRFEDDKEVQRGEPKKLPARRNKRRYGEFKNIPIRSIKFGVEMHTRIEMICPADAFESEIQSLNFLRKIEIYIDELVRG